MNAAAQKDLLERTALLILTNVRVVPVSMVGSVMMAWQIIAVSVHQDIRVIFFSLVHLNELFVSFYLLDA